MIPTTDTEIDLDIAHLPAELQLTIVQRAKYTFDTLTWTLQDGTLHGVCNNEDIDPTIRTAVSHLVYNEILAYRDHDLRVAVFSRIFER